VAAVRKVKAGHIHASLQHFPQHSFPIRCRTKGADNLRLSHTHILFLHLEVIVFRLYDSTSRPPKQWTFFVKMCKIFRFSGTPRSKAASLSVYPQTGIPLLKKEPTGN
jgi:hypothetical protein